MAPHLRRCPGWPGKGVFACHWCLAATRAAPGVPLTLLPCPCRAPEAPAKICLSEVLPGPGPVAAAIFLPAWALCAGVAAAMLGRAAPAHCTCVAAAIFGSSGPLRQPPRADPANGCMAGRRSFHWRHSPPVGCGIAVWHLPTMDCSTGVLGGPAGGTYGDTSGKCAYAACCWWAWLWGAAFCSAAGFLGGTAHHPDPCLADGVAHTGGNWASGGSVAPVGASFSSSGAGGSPAPPNVHVRRHENDPGMHLQVA